MLEKWDINISLTKYSPIDYVLMDTMLTLKTVASDTAGGENDGVDRYDLYFKYSNKDEETKTCQGAVILKVESKSIKYIQSRVTMLATVCSMKTARAASNASMVAGSSSAMSRV